MAGKIKKTEAQGMKAIKREFDLEKMLTSEIQAKVQMETKMMMDKKKREEYKNKCLDQAFSARKATSDKTRTNNSALSRMDSIKKEARNQIKKKRANMRNKIKNILAGGKRKKRKIAGEIRLIRSAIAKKLINAGHKGSMSVCVNGMDSAKKRLDYCKNNIVDSYVGFNDCFKEANYGQVCCENEFGSMQIDSRDKCIKKCDGKLHDSLNGGDFV